jgi:acetyl esterase/lipase
MIPQYDRPPGFRITDIVDDYLDWKWYRCPLRPSTNLTDPPPSSPLSSPLSSFPLPPSLRVTCSFHSSRQIIQILFSFAAFPLMFDNDCQSEAKVNEEDSLDSRCWQQPEVEDEG